MFTPEGRRLSGRALHREQHRVAGQNHCDRKTVGMGTAEGCDRTSARFKQHIRAIDQS